MSELMNGSIPVAKDHAYNNGIGGNQPGIGGNGIDFPLLADMQVIPEIKQDLFSALDEHGDKVFEASSMYNGIKGAIKSELPFGNTTLGTKVSERGIG